MPFPYWLQSFPWLAQMPVSSLDHLKPSARFHPLILRLKKEEDKKKSDTNMFLNNLVQTPAVGDLLGQDDLLFYQAFLR